MSEYKLPYTGDEITSKLVKIDNVYTKDEIDSMIGGDLSLAYDYSTTDLVAGSSSLPTGRLYFVYE